MFCNTLQIKQISFKTYFFEKKSLKREQRIRKVYIFAVF